MSTISTTKEKVLEAAEKTPGLKIALKTLFPDAFADEVDVIFRTGDILVQNGSKKSYLIAVDSNKNLRIVGVTSGYIWDDKNIKIEHQCNITPNQIRAVFGLRNLKNYTLNRKGQSIEL